MAAGGAAQRRGGGGGEPVAGARAFTTAEVAGHDSAADAWVIVRGKVYDVTAWVPRHPGGDLILVKAGKDCTQLFESYHSLVARRTLEKYYIGDVASPADGWIEYEDDTQDGKFYSVLKQRVEKYMKDNKINPRWAPAMYVKSALILGTLFTSFYGGFFYFSSMPVCLVCAVLMGAAMAEVGVSIQHDANHGAYSSNRSICHWMGWMLDVVGASSFMWKQQHVVGHHAYTNLHEVDPDIRVSAKDVRRVTSWQPWHYHQRFQHIYLGVLYGLLAIKSVLVDDFAALSEGKIGPVTISRLTGREKLEFWGGKLLFMLYFVVLPLVSSHHSLGELVALWVVSELVAGWMLAFMFQVAHVTPDVEYVRRDSSGRVARGWAELQAATSADFSHGSFFWTHMSGGLNYQVVHHLFPGICHVHYPKIAPIVLDTCKEFNVPYCVYPTFGAALGAHFRHLRNMGAGRLIPSLSTVG